MADWPLAAVDIYLSKAINSHGGRQRRQPREPVGVPAAAVASWSDPPLGWRKQRHHLLRTFTDASWKSLCLISHPQPPTTLLVPPLLFISGL